MINLTGTGIGPIANLNPNALAFAAQAVGTTSPAQIVTLTNTGASALNLTNISVTGAFGETNTCSTSLAAGSSCQVSVTFSPTAVGSAAANLTITDNAGSPQTVALSGVGTAGPDFSVGVASGSSTSQTISAGQNAKFSLLVTPSGSFAGTINLTCSLLPVVSPAPTCILSSSSVQISGGTAQPVTVTVGTTAAATTNPLPRFGFPSGATSLTWMTMLLALGLPLLSRKHRQPLTASLIVLAFVSLTGCGGGGSSPAATPGTPSGTYTATITATSASLNHNTAVTIVVE